LIRLILMMILNGLLLRLLFAFEKYPSSIDSSDDHDRPE
jgi:hypothetical protein